MNKKSIVIIGGGASGLFCACVAGKLLHERNDIEIIILERMDKVGKKLLATGNGRCNLTNIFANEKNFFSSTTQHCIVKKTLETFSPQKTIDFFESIGIVHKVESEGKVYPSSDQASSVLDCLRFESAKYNVKEICNFDVVKIKQTDEDHFVICSKNQKLFANRVIVATGGTSSCSLGSNGSGYALMQSFSHRVSTLHSAIVHMKTQSSTVPNSLKGIKANAQVSLFAGENLAQSTFGEILFTEFGLSGLPIFELSAFIAQSKIRKVDFDFLISLDFMPQKTLSETLTFFNNRKTIVSNRKTENFFNGLLNKRIGMALLKQCNIKTKDCCDLCEKEIYALAKVTKNFVFDIEDNMPFLKSQATAGGVLIDEFDFSLKSKKCKNLFCCGEVLDVFGDCGGFNLQWAWASGFVSATAAAQNI